MKIAFALFLIAFELLGIIKTKSDENKKKVSEVATEPRPNVVFEKLVHEFGNIKEGIQATVQFDFENTGNAPLLLNSTFPNSGCIYAIYPRHPIEPGEKGEVKVIYNTTGRPGNFTKTITINHNGEANGGTVYLTIKGTAEPFPKPPIVVFDKMEHDFGIIDEGIQATTDFYLINKCNEPIEITRVDASSGCVTPTWSSTPIEPGATGKISVVFNSNGNAGDFRKTLVVKFNKYDQNDFEVLTIKGTVESSPK